MNSLQALQDRASQETKNIKAEINGMKVTAENVTNQLKDAIDSQATKLDAQTTGISLAHTLAMGKQTAEMEGLRQQGIANASAATAAKLSIEAMQVAMTNFQRENGQNMDSMRVAVEQQAQQQAKFRVLIYESK